MTISTERFKEVARFMQMAEVDTATVTPKKEVVVAVEPVAIEAITKEGAFEYIHSLKPYLGIEEDSFIINYDYRDVDVEMVVLEGSVVRLEFNPTLRAGWCKKYNNLPVYSQVREIA